MIWKTTPFYKRIFNNFRRTPITLYALEFENDNYSNNNIYMTSFDRTIDFYTPYYWNGMVTGLSVDEGEELISNTNHIRLESSDLYVANIQPVYSTTDMFTGVGDSVPYNELIDDVVVNPSFTPQADIFVNLRTGKMAKILKCWEDRVTIAIGNELTSGLPMNDNKLLDPFVILRKRSFIPFGVAHDDYNNAEISENINTNLKLDNMASLWNNMWINTNQFDTARLTIIYTYMDTLMVNGQGPLSEGINAFDYDIFYVNATEFNKTVMVLKCIDRLQANTSTILRRTFTKNQCPWAFGSHSCGAFNEQVESFSNVCPGSYGECSLRQNVENYGGFINIQANDTGGNF
jgi:phage-related protein